MMNITFHNSKNWTRLNAIFWSQMAIIVSFIITIINAIIVFGGTSDARAYMFHTTFNSVPYYFAEIDRKTWAPVKEVL